MATMAKKRVGEPWMPADEYGRSLPAFTLNLLVADIARSIAFYRDVLGSEVRYWDADFAALKVGELDFMLHADHTYEGHPWSKRLGRERRRGLGAELRLFEVDPDAAVARAREAGALVLMDASDKPHGWREAWLEDPDGYVWAVGVATKV